MDVPPPGYGDPTCPHVERREGVCVRCGHCAWACEDLYGAARLVRRGDKVVARVTSGREAPTSLLLPNSCQHCENPTCMVGCPTGAIGRDPDGEVFIRPELCTGCGACAKASSAKRQSDIQHRRAAADFIAKTLA